MLYETAPKSEPISAPRTPNKMADRNTGTATRPFAATCDVFVNSRKITAHSKKMPIASPSRGINPTDIRCLTMKYNREVQSWRQEATSVFSSDSISFTSIIFRLCLANIGLLVASIAVCTEQVPPGSDPTDTMTGRWLSLNSYQFHAGRTTLHIAK